MKEVYLVIATQSSSMRVRLLPSKRAIVSVVNSTICPKSGFVFNDEMLDKLNDMGYIQFNAVKCERHDENCQSFLRDPMMCLAKFCFELSFSQIQH